MIFKWQNDIQMMGWYLNDVLRLKWARNVKVTTEWWNDIQMTQMTIGWMERHSYDSQHELIIQITVKWNNDI